MRVISNGYSVNFELSDNFYSEIIEFSNYTIRIHIGFNSPGSDAIEYWKDKWVPIEAVVSKNINADRIVSHIREQANKLLGVASTVLKTDRWIWDNIEGRDDDIMEIVSWGEKK